MENSRVIIVDLLASSSDHSDEQVSTNCCPRTGHYSSATQQQQLAVGTAKPARKYASVSHC